MSGLAVITRLYVRPHSLPVALATMLNIGLITWITGVSTTYGLSTGAALRVRPDGTLGLIPSATDAEKAAAIAEAALPGTDTDFPFGSGAPLVVDEQHCIEIALRYGSPKGYAALRVDDELVSEAQCITMTWFNTTLLGTPGPGSHLGFFANEYDDWTLDDVAFNDESGASQKSWPGADTGVFLGDPGGCLADPAGSGYYDCGLSSHGPLPPTCPRTPPVIEVEDAKDGVMRVKRRSKFPEIDRHLPRR